MAQNFLTIALRNRTNKIGLWVIFKTDLLPWLASAGLVLLIFVGVSSLVGDTNPNLNEGDATANLYTRARPLYYALIVLAVFSARRSKNVWTWTISIFLIIFFIPQNGNNIANALMPNGILQPLIAMLGILAAGRIVEYVRMRHIIQLSEPILSVVAVLAYGVIVLLSLLMLMPAFFEVVWG